MLTEQNKVQYITDETIIQAKNMNDIQDAIIDANTKIDTHISNHPNGDGGSIDITNLATKDDLKVKVDKVYGKGLSTNDYTTSEKNKLASMSNPDVNKEYVDLELNKKANKTDIHTHNNKTVLDTITSTKINEWNLKATTSYVDNKIEEAYSNIDTSSLATKEELKLKSDKSYVDNALNNKSDVHSHPYKSNSYVPTWAEIVGKPNIPTKTSDLINDKNFATEVFVTSKIAEAQLDGGDVDLSSYATKDELNVKVDKISGKGLSTNDYTTSDKNKLAGLQNSDVTKAYVDIELAKKSDIHAHPYKPNTYVPSWNELTSKPTIPTVDVTKVYVDTELEKKANLIHNHNEYATNSDLNNKVDKVSGKGLSTNDFTTSEKTKLSGLSNYTHPANHSANVITQDPNNRFVTDSEKARWDDKSDFTGDYNSLTNKPTIPTVDVNKSYVDSELIKKADVVHPHSEYTTESKVANMIAEAQLDGGDVDLSGFATKDELSVKVDKIVGKNLSTNDFTNTLKAKLDGLQNSDVTKTYVDAELAKKADTHTHPYKPSSYVPTWNEVSNKPNSFTPSVHVHSYNDLNDKPTIPTVDVNKTYVDTELGKKSNIHQHPYMSDSYIPSWDELTNKPASYNPTSHKHDDLYATKSSEHMHSNRSVLDSITTININEWSGKETVVGSQEKANKALLDANKYTDEKIYEVIDSSPEALNTLSELSKALGDDPNFATTVTNEIGRKADKNYVDTEVGKKSDIHTHPYKSSSYIPSWSEVTDKPTTFSPSIHNHNDMYYTELEIDNALKLKCDVGGVYSKAEADTILNQKANVNDLHEHDNKLVLNVITFQKINEWDSKSNFTGSYNDLTNKPNIPVVDVTKSYVDAELNKKIDKSGHVFTDNNYTDTEKIKLTGLSNYTHPDNSSVRHVTDAEKSTWNSKSNFDGNYNSLINKPVIPTVDVTKSYVDTELGNKANIAHPHSEYAEKSNTYTKTEVDTAISEAQIGGDVDLSNYYTKRETYSYDEVDVMLNNKASKSHNHDANYASKVSFDSHIANHPGGSGGSTEIVDNLTSTSITSALSANQGKVLNEKVSNLSVNSTKPDANGNIILQGNQIPCWDSSGTNKGNVHSYIDFLCNENNSNKEKIATLNAKIASMENKVNELSDKLNSILPSNKVVINPYKDAIDNILKFQTHCHTDSSDGLQSTSEVADKYLMYSGYSNMVISNHDYISQPWASNDFLAMYGVEESETDQHIGVVGLIDRYQKYEIANRVELINKHKTESPKAVFIINHPARTDNLYSDEELLNLADHVNCIEIWNQQDKNSKHEALWDMLLTKGKKIYGVCADDCHDVTNNDLFNGGWTELLANNDYDSILNAFKNGQFYSCHRHNISISYNENTKTITASSKDLSDFEFKTENGVVVKESKNCYNASYSITETDNGYIRAKSILSSDKTNFAYSQPFFIVDDKQN